jgi:putative ABC transport system permease protein
LVRVFDVHPGFAPEHLLGAQVALPQHKYPKTEQIAIVTRTIAERLRALPGASSAAVTLRLPMTGSHFSSFGIEGKSLPAYRAPACEYYGATPNYFETIGTPLLRGRRFAESDSAATPRVVIVNETLARNFFANENPIGRRLMVWRASPQPREIVGVVADIRQGALDEAVRPTVYLPWEQDPEGDFGIVIRSAGDPRALTGAVRAAIAEVDPDIVTYLLRPMAEVVSGSPSVALRRVPALMIAILAGIAVLLAGVGIAGVLASVVNRRTQEIGVRMALGASASSVVRMMVTRGMLLTGAGVTLGLGAAWAATRGIQKLLYGVSASDPLTYAGVAALLSIVALAACWIPSARAARVDPIVVLREE